MSKSVEGSYINLTDSLEDIQKALAGAPTDSGKGETVPAEGGVANLFKFVELFQGIDRRREYEAAYTSTGVRYGDLKKDLALAILAELQPIQIKRKELEAQPQLVDEVIEVGAAKASHVAQQTMNAVKQKMGLI